jgi:hypothetical protein
MKMFGRVFVFRRIAATYVAALQAHPQVHPRIAHLDAFLANMFRGLGNPDLI